jgi:ethanolamine ammonia-lyase small subunit
MPSEGKIEEERREIGAISQPVPTAPQVTAKSPVLEKIEDILEEDLEQIYFAMPPQKQAEFNKVGEETATQINQLLQGVRVQARKILDLIVRWLKIIPGVNKYFLEQEAKIKTDELLKLRADQKQQEPGQSGINDQNRI